MLSSPLDLVASAATAATATAAAASAEGSAAEGSAAEEAMSCVQRLLQPAISNFFNAHLSSISAKSFRLFSAFVRSACRARSADNSTFLYVTQIVRGRKL